MEKETKIKVVLSSDDAKKLGINGAIDANGEIIKKFDNDVDGYLVSVKGKTVAIADKYNAITKI